ncbi:hypothetical protein CC86DRAFT_25923 [Ophiobolus disseminans]|uniref:Disease resistance R13L4/SHOC-2-like LRR domain-containing protein n=1 Tax=Ophiobolus disseminans TaxID=1469910 RepID=A0A6A7A0W3_9PLEO|nr:hypothetical protein CC86DRAFT_25923 [Ophiobolus disseminans]
MAELVGSIIGIVSAGTKVALVLSQLASDIGTAGQEARMISCEIRTFCTVLNTLKDTMEKIHASHYYAHCTNMVRDMTDASLEMFTELLDAAEALKGMTAGKDGRDGKFSMMSKVHWVVFQKPKIIVLRAAIEAYKSNIALMLGTLDIAEKVARRTSVRQHADIVAQDVQEQATHESLELDLHSSLLNLKQAESQYEDDIAQPPVEWVNAAVGPLPSGIIENNDEDINTTLDTEKQERRATLLQMARIEVGSVRSSLSSDWNFQCVGVTSRCTRHSQRLSRMMEEDQRRLSQRWSTLSFPEQKRFSGTPFLKSTFTPEPPTAKLDVKKVHAITHQPQYESFQVWFRTLFSHHQQEILEALEKDILMRKSPRLYSTLRPSPEPQRSLPTWLFAASEEGSAKRGSGNSDAITTQSSTGADAISIMVIAMIKQQYTHQFAFHQSNIQDSSKTDRPFVLDLVLSHVNLDDLSEEIMAVLQHTRPSRLTLKGNRLTTVPLQFSLCIHLRFLDLSYNSFETIPVPILRLKSLKTLDMRDNLLQTIPTTIPEMRNLARLILTDNKIQIIPRFIKNMGNLQELICIGNPITFPPPGDIDLGRLYSSSLDPDDTPKTFHASRTRLLKMYLKVHDEQIAEERGTTA